jgi:hypothetical protein
MIESQRVSEHAPTGELPGASTGIFPAMPGIDDAAPVSIRTAGTDRSIEPANDAVRGTETEADVPDTLSRLGFRMDPAKREALVRRAAYMLYERRGRVDGHHEEDWLRAEALIDRALLGLLSREIFPEAGLGADRADT